MKQIIALLMCVVASSLTFATSSQDLSSLLSNMHTMQADFVQTTYDNHGKAIQTSHGKMAISRPGKFRWDIRKPIPQLIVANDTRLWVYDPDLEQVTIRALHQAAGQSPAFLLSQENASIDKDYVVEQTPHENSVYWQWFTLTPRQADSMLAKIEIGFMQKKLQKMQLEDHLGHITKIEFQHAETNVNLPSALFIFKKPANVDVIDETPHS